MINVDHTLALAKRGELSRSQLYARMQSIAEARRGPDESTAQAFVRFIGTDEGREMFAIQKALPGHDIEPSAVVTKSDIGASEWSDLVRAMRKAYGYTESQAIDACLSTEAGKYAFAKTKRAQQIAANVGFTKADMECLDACVGDGNVWVEMHKGAPLAGDVHVPTTYEALLDDAQRKFPGMSESKAHDFVRSKNPEAWEEHKKLNKLGGGRRLPEACGQREQAGDEHPRAARSGRKQPSRAPQWESDHSGSPATTPEHEPERMDDKPAVKALNGVLDNLQTHTGLERERLIPILKRIPVGKRLVDMAVAEL